MNNLRFLLLVTTVVCFTQTFASPVKLPHQPKSHASNYLSIPYKENNSLIRAAEELATWKLYAEAIPAYSRVIEALPSTNTQLKTSLALRKAQLYLIIGAPQEAIETLESLSLGTADSEKTSLKALGYIQLNNPKQALSLLHSGINSPDILMAMAYKMIGDEQKALDYLEKVPEKSDEYVFSRVLLTKIGLSQGSYQQALEELQALTLKISPNHPLYPEVLWLLGTTQYNLGNIVESIVFFEEALTLPTFQSHHWYSTCIEQLAHVYLTLCNHPKSSLTDKERILTRAEQMVDEELKRRNSERLTITLAKILLTKNSYFPSEETVYKCKSLLCDEERLKTQPIQTESLILQAQLATGYQEREKYLNALTSIKNEKDIHTLSYGWLLRGHNEREESYRSTPQNVRKHLENAGLYYEKAYELFDHTSQQDAYQALRNWAQTAHELKDIHLLEKIYKSIQPAQKPEELRAETYYIKSLIATHLYDLSGNENYLDAAIQELNQGLQENPSDSESSNIILLLGKVYFLKNSFAKTETTLAVLSEGFPDSPIASESLYWCGRAAEKNSHPLQTPQSYYQKCYRDYPSSSFAAEAFFREYTYQDYLHGEKEGRKHLEEFLTQFPDSHYVMDAYFLLGLDSKRDRKSTKGKWISKTNITKAIDLFQQVNTEYQRFKNNNLLPPEQLDHYASLELRATLERALSNLAIARASSGAKKHIYLQYAEEVFTNLIETIEQPNLTDHQQDTLEEARYGLAQTYIESRQFAEAEATIHQIIEAYTSSKVTRGYYLSRSWHDLYLIASETPSSDPKSTYSKALEYLYHAEECAKGRVLSTDQTIDLWLKMSHCHKMMGDYDQAMRYLTKAIDEDAISSLRVKAMYLRAEIYELQGRLELSRKQLQATSKKGGEWGQKAKDKLGDINGYH